MNNLLIVQTRAFIYGWLGSTQRIYDLAGGLSKHGWRTTLLTATRKSNALTRTSNPSFENSFPGDIVSAPFAGGPWPNWADSKGLRRLWLIACRLLHVNSLALWANRFSNWLDVGRLSGGTVQVVWTVNIDSAWNAQIGLYLAARFACPLVVEFQDPVPGPHRRLSTYEEKSMVSCLETAALVVTTTKAYADHLEQRFPCCQGKTRTVYLSFADELLGATRGIQTRDEDRLVLLHAGYLYDGSGRNALGLVSGLARTAELEPASRGKIVLRLMGSGPGIGDAARLAKELGIAEAVECLPQASVQEAVAQQVRADVLVVIKFPDPVYDMQIPGKLFACLPYGKPILGIMGECEAAEILRRTGLGLIAAHEDIDGIARHLLGAWRNRNMLSQTIHPDWVYISQFSRSNMASTLDMELSRIMNEYANC